MYFPLRYLWDCGSIHSLAVIIIATFIIMYTATNVVNISDELRARFTGHPVSVPLFEGPLDLLIYFIKRQEIDINDIPISTITRQFLDYIKLMEVLDIELASDFLVMAATLLEIKSRMLLPRPPAMIEEKIDEDEDPRAELVRRLLEYTQYKSAAQELQKRAEERSQCVSRPDIVATIPLPKVDPEFSVDPDSFNLWKALQEVLARAEAAGPTFREVSRPRVSIRQQMMYILKQLEKCGPDGIVFADIFFTPDCDFPLTRTTIIITFLAVLELMRMHRITIIQKELFGQIRIAPTQGQLLN